MSSRMRLFSTVLAAATGLLLTAPALAASLSEDWAGPALGGDLPQTVPGGPVTPQDLLRMRDFGGLSISPDGRRLAFSLRQADPEADDYRQVWFVAAADGASRPLPLQAPPGRPIMPYRGGVPHGSIPADPAKWSPDGSQLAFRRQAGEAVELWTADPTTGASRRVYAGPAQVGAFAWSRDGVLVFRTGFDPAGFRAWVAAEVRHGWRLDSRLPLWAARAPSPLPPDCEADPSEPGCDARTLALGAGGVRPATQAETEALERGLKVTARALARPPRIVRGASEVSPSGASAWTEVIEPSRAPNLGPAVRITTNAGAGGPCPAAACAGQYFPALGLARGGTTVWFLRRVSSVGGLEPGPLDQVALYEWRPGTASARQVLRTHDLLESCQARAAILFCLRSSATRPAHVVAIALDSGRTRALLDPNPAFAGKRLPRVRTFDVTDPAGNFGFGHLVYPNDYRPGTAYPLVVVQYRSMGFLRGGTGDEIPIYPLAASGFFVLSLDKPENRAGAQDLNNVAWMRADRKGQAGPRNTTAAILEVVDGLVAEGLVDRERVAITGLSAGAQVVHHALQQTNRFAAAIASQGVADLSYFAQFPEGPLKPMWMTAFDAKGLTPAPGDLLYEIAWSQQPEKLRAPLLLNLGQHEALFGFEGFAALARAGRPLEVRVYPDEGHVKYRPSAYAGVYETNLRWLEFWLQDRERPEPAFAASYQRWRGMREALNAEAGANAARPGRGAVKPGPASP